MAVERHPVFQVRLLAREELRLALPLARMLYPGLTEADWLAYAAGAPPVPLPRQALVASNPTGNLRGLCTVAQGYDLRCGRTLDVEDFVVADFLDMRSVVATLLSGIEEVGRAAGCRTVRVHLDDSSLPRHRPIVDALNSVGHVRTTVRFAKPMVRALPGITGASA